jgi:hypothetical protein
MQSVNKQVSQRRLEQQHSPSNIGEGKACNNGCRVAAQESREGHIPMGTLKKTRLQLQQAGRGIKLIPDICNK